jgi:diguanylate cyclase (GGDEF)-like protein/PAS domain S-box-containing protein
VSASSVFLSVVRGRLRSARVGAGQAAESELAYRRGAEAALRNAEARFRRAFEDAPIGMALVGLDGRWLRVNRVMCQLAGYPAEQLLTLTRTEVVHPADREQSTAEIQRVVDGEVAVLESERRYVRGSGEVIWVQLSVSLVRDAEGRPLYLIEHAQDITERRHTAQHLSHLADHDPHTGLYNRRRFETELEQEVTRREGSDEPAALMLIDLDDFKHVNDTLGHAAGDELLSRVAGALREQLRRTDILARLGGDEFAVILPDIEQDGACVIAESLLEVIRRDCVVLGATGPLRASATIGIAMIDPLRARSSERLLIDADLAMYAGKAAGRNQVMVRDPDDNAAVALNETVTWVERIRHALHHDRFVLYEQPLVELCSGEVTRHEILLRMVAEDGEHIAPLAFLPIAERFGLVGEIDVWVIRNAIALIAREARRGRRLQLEVNISGASVTDPELLAVIEQEIATAEIDPAALIFEITETAAIVNIEQARTFAERLAELGCGFALDDFGAGFGSFYYLKHLPFTTLKIDGEFIRGLVDSERDQIMVKAIAGVAMELGTETVAEFVPDRATQELLRSYGVHYAQGYGIGRPQPIAVTWPEDPLGLHAEPADSAAAPA